MSSDPDRAIEQLCKKKMEVMTHSLKGVFGFLQVLLALALQDHGPLVDGTEVGATAGGSRGNSSPLYH